VPTEGHIFFWHRRLRRRRRARNGAFTVIELVAAFAILFTLISGFGVAIKGVFEVEHRLRIENEGIVVLNNVLERLEAEKTWDVRIAALVLKEEFSRSELAKSSRLHPVCNEQRDRIMVCIMKDNGKPLVGIELMK
jgi:hypothetical protein